jgi:hypothetical protein
LLFRGSGVKYTFFVGRTKHRRVSNQNFIGFSQKKVPQKSHPIRRSKSGSCSNF